jgi:hypothetical protein
VTGCPLADPGILLAMLAPSDEPVPLPPPAASARLGLAPAAAVAAGGAALACAVVVAAQHARHELPFGSAWSLGFGGVVLAGWLGLLLGRFAALRFATSPFRTTMAFRTTVVGCGGSLLLAIAALFAAGGAPHAAPAWFPLAAALGITLAALAPGPGSGLRGLGAWLVFVFGAAIGAMAAAGSCNLGGVAPFLVAVVVTLLAIVVVALAPTARFAAPNEDLRGRALVARVVSAAAALAAWFVLARTLPVFGADSGAANASPFVAMLPAALVPVAITVAAVVAIAAASQRSPWLASFAVSVAAAVAWVDAARPQLATETVVAATARAEVRYARANQELRLCVDGQLVDAVGPDRPEVPLAATIVRTFAAVGDRALLVELGSGRLAAALANAGELVVDVVDSQPHADAVRARLAADGPVPSDAIDACTAPFGRVRRASATAAIAAMAPGSRQLAIFASCAAQRGARTSVDVQQQLRAVVGDGFVVQLLALDHTPPAVLHEVFAAAAAAHAWNGLFVVGDGAVLVSAAAPLDWSRDALASECSWREWPAAARWLAHRAHLGDAADLQRTMLGTLVMPATVPQPAAPRSEGAGRAGALEVLRAWLVPAAEVASSPSGVLRRWQALQAELRAAGAQLRQLTDTAADRAKAQVLAARFLPVGARSPELQAALGLAATDGTTLLAPAAASRRALAIEPTFFRTLPAVFAALPLPRQATGELEDVSVLPPAPRLAVVAAGDDPLAIAMRARFPSHCAEALVAALAAGPLPPPAAQALRELADPFVLREAAAVLAGAQREPELLGLWRADLPMPTAVAALAARSADDQRTLAAALRGRRDPSCHPVLADLLQADAVEVRQLAAEALATAVGALVPYDPNWPQSARREAAERLRSLHNRAP